MRVLVISLATVMHLLPHPFGVSTVGALALYAGAFGRRPAASLVPLVPLALGLLLTGLYEPIILAAVGLGFVLATFAGRGFLARKRGLGRYGGAVVTGAAIFYLVSNLAVWVVYYPRNLDGLVACFVNGLPYLGQSMLADAAYCFVLFGFHALLERRKAVLSVA